MASETPGSFLCGRFRTGPFVHLFTSPWSLLTVLAWLSAAAFTTAVTLWHFSSLPACGATAGHPEQGGKTRCLKVQFLIISNAHVHLPGCALACVCMLFYERWSNDKMSCDQWAVDRTLQTKWKESPLTDLVRFRPPGPGHCSTKSALSLSGTPKGLLHRPCSPQQHQATKSTSTVCAQLKKVNNILHIQTLNCGKCLNDLTGLHLAITFFLHFNFV